VKAGFPNGSAGETGSDGQLWLPVPPGKGEEIAFDVMDVFKSLIDIDKPIRHIFYRIELWRPPSGPWLSFNEWDCIQTLKELSAAEERFREDAVIDTDGDGAGEYGYLQDLAAGLWVSRDAKGPAIKQREYLEPAFTNVDENGILTMYGYHFKLFLPRAGAGPAGETNPLSAVDARDADLRERGWICYAWPAFFDATGKRCFAVNQQGEVFGARNWANERPFYYGLETVPGATAAFQKGHPEAEALTAPIPFPGEVANDGQLWNPAEM
jgi:hypothetical protein